MRSTQHSAENIRSFLIDDRHGTSYLKKYLRDLSGMIFKQVSVIKIIFSLERPNRNTVSLISHFFDQLNQLHNIENRVEVEWYLGQKEDINNLGLHLQDRCNFPFDLIRKPAKKILMVDPDFILKELMILNYLNRPIDLNYSMNGKEAIEMISHHQYDLIISELNLDYFSGWELISRLRMKDYKGNVIVLSDEQTIRENRNELLRMGLTYETKPIDIQRFNEKIEMFLKSGNYERYAS